MSYNIKDLSQVNKCNTKRCSRSKNKVAVFINLFRLLPSRYERDTKRTNKCGIFSRTVYSKSGIPARGLSTTVDHRNNTMNEILHKRIK